MLTALFSCGRTPPMAAPFSMNDDPLFAQMPENVKRLNEQSKKEARLKRRYAWAVNNPNNPRVAGKKLNKP